MSDLTIWHDTQRDRWYVQHKHQLEEILPLTLEYMKDMQSEIEKLREKSERLFDKTLELATENAKLRELMYDRAHRHAIQNMTEDELRITATNAMDENSSLREILSDLWDFTGEQLPIDEFKRRFKELGVHA